MARRRPNALLAALAIAGCARAVWAQQPSAAVVADRAADASARRGCLSADGTPLVRTLAELRLGDLAWEVVTVLRVGDEALVPLSRLLRLAEIPVERPADGARRGASRPGLAPQVVTPAGDALQYGDRRVTVASGHRVTCDDELYVGVGALSVLLASGIVVDWPELSIVVADPSPLPIGRRVAREAARRELLRAREASEAPVERHPLERPLWDGLVLDYTIGAPAASPLRASSYSVALGANVLGGSLEAGFSGVGSAGRDVVRSTATWSGVWSDNRWVRQLRVGDGVATGMSAVALRGVGLSNAPFLRPTVFGEHRFGGSLAPGWEIEAYRGGVLLAVDSTDASGAFAIPIPAQYGENAVEFLAYGPAGEVRRFSRAYRVVGALLPAGRLEYGASAGSCPSRECSGAANVDVRYGISPRWTVRAGYEGLRRDSLGSVARAYAGVAGSPADAVGIQLEGVTRSLARGVLRYEPSTTLRVVGEYARYADAPSVAAPERPAWRSRWAASGLVRPAGGRGTLLHVEGEAARIETRAGAITQARLATSLQRWETRVSPYLRLEADRSAGPTRGRSFVGANAFLLPRGGATSPLGPAWVRAGLEVERAAGLSEASLAVTRPFAHGIRAELGGRWTPHGSALSLLTSVDLAAMRSHTVVHLPDAGRATADQYVQGSVLVSPATREVTLTAGPSLRRAGLAGRVFLDLNASGTFDAAEPALADVTLHVNGTTTTSDAAGRFEVRDVPPYERTSLSVDSLSLRSPLWVPARATIVVQPGPNRVTLVDVPIVPGGVVGGNVVLEAHGGREGLGGVRLTLTDRRSGARRVLTTFADGAFTAVPVPPGEYEVTVDDRELERLAARGRPTRFTLAPDANGARVTGLDVVLVRDVASGDPSAGAPPARPRDPLPRGAATDSTVTRRRSDGPRAAVARPSPSPADADAGPPARPPVVVHYTVRKHDTLRRIARRVLGSEARWKEIYQSNRDRIGRPDLVRPGQTLLIRVVAPAAHD